ncbi:UNVERIFIED_CONTAM: hypothetical protein HDU68_005655, partial [Siphonaria sp. JEL0065]
LFNLIENKGEGNFIDGLAMYVKELEGNEDSVGTLDAIPAIRETIKKDTDAVATVEDPVVADSVIADRVVADRVVAAEDDQRVQTPSSSPILQSRTQSATENRGQNQEDHQAEDQEIKYVKILDDLRHKINGLPPTTNRDKLLVTLDRIVDAAVIDMQAVQDLVL